jgi:SAM-dependent methyltransferase
MNDLSAALNDGGVASPWEKHAAQWNHIGPPLRPCPQDIQFVQTEVNDIARARNRVEALMLGVTVEITAIRWPLNCSLTAVDSSRAMLIQRWRAPPGIKSAAIQGLWEQLPVPRKSLDLVLADGSLSVLPSARGVAEVLRELGAVVSPGGRIVTRVFIRQETEPTPGEVIDAMRRGKYGNFHVFKWRLLMALHNCPTEGVLLHAVYETVCDAIPDRAALARELGWTLESVNTIDAYKDVFGRYFFPCLAQFRELMGGDLRERDCLVPTYELGERCPTIVLACK